MGTNLKARPTKNGGPTLAVGLLAVGLLTVGPLKKERCYDCTGTYQTL